MKGIIYCAENNINNRVYIGQTIQTLDRRKNRHRRSHSNFHFHNALRKYGDWNWNVICDVEAPNNILLKEYLDIVESIYIEQYDSFGNGYNLTKGGGGTLGSKRSEESKTRMSVAHKGRKHSKEHKDRISESLKGRICLEETKVKISISEKGKIVSEETRVNISTAQKNRSEESRSKHSASLKGRATWNKGKTGIYSEETKAKMSVAAKIRWAKQREAPCRI